MLKRLSYWRRIFKVYFTGDKGYLSFWHEKPAVSEGINKDELGPYYQTFEDKAKYTGPKDDNGVILFDYFFDIGRQYNPLAVAQYGLGNWNLYLKTKDKKYLEIAKIQADWLVKNLEANNNGLMVWKHKFRWHYKQWLEAGWYSAHSQGTGISLLARLYKETGNKRYFEAAQKAFVALNTEIKNGGTRFIDENGNSWLEEYLVNPPTHILNGFLWALWGVYDYWLLARYAQEQEVLSETEGLPLEKQALGLWNACVLTLKNNLHKYDAGYWSLYDLSKQFLKMLASPFYHSLHIVQLKVMHILTDEEIFKQYSEKFDAYTKSWLKRKRAFAYKAIFKLIYF